VQVGGKRLLDPAVIAVIQDWRQVSMEVDEKGMLQVGLLT
jgi:sugar-phosphatase